MTSNHIFNYDQGLTLREKKSRFSLLSKIEKKNLKKCLSKVEKTFLGSKYIWASELPLFPCVFP